MIGYKKVNMKNITIDGVEYTPVIKPQTELPTTVQGVYDEVKPEWAVYPIGQVMKIDYSCDYAQLPTQALAEKALAYIQLLTVCHWANERFEEEGNKCKYILTNTLLIDWFSGETNIVSVWYLNSKAAAEYIKEHHLELVKKFYGV